MEAAPSDRELDGYRAGADRFIAELDEEYYLHYAGLKPEFELRPIYERHADLTDLETIRRLGEAVAGRENLELFRFGCEGFLGELTREHTEKIAESEATLEIQHEGEPLGYRMLPPTIANTADRDTRAKLETKRNQLTEEHLNPIYLDAAHTTQRAIPELGAPTYLELYRDRFQYDLDGLAAQCRAFLDSTERLYEDSMDRVLRERVGIGLAEAERWDVRRFFRGSSWDAAFTADRMLPALRGTLAGLGIDLDSQHNVHLDVEERPTKSPRAFCAPVEILGDALKVEPSGTDYLADIDSGYYVTSYLRAWAFSAQMTSFLREEFGTDWFKRREAGSLLVDLWRLGQKPNADELLKDVTGAAVEMEAVAEHVRSAIPTPA